MENPQLTYIRKCKILIEEQLSWSVKSIDWKQRDYLNLISILEEKTDIALSLSTIKRIWREDYTGNPHPATLDALAKFLDYDNWLEFREDQKNKERSSQEFLAPEHTSPKKRFPWYFLLLALPTLGLALYLVLSKNTSDKKTSISYSPKAISFSASNSKSGGVPNTVIFNYDISSVVADSFFIQQSWNPFNREKVQPTDSVLTSIYYYPGVHIAKLIVNDSIIAETILQVNSEGWIATVDYGIVDPIPTYIPLDDLNGKRQLYIPKSKLLANDIAVNEKLNIKYYYVDDLPKISGDDFMLTTSFSADSISNITCPSIQVMILGTVETHLINLMDKGCVHQAYLKFGKQLIHGKNADLSDLGINVYENQQLTLHVVGKKGKVYLNDQLISEVAYGKSIGDITGISFGFSGTGRVSRIELREARDGEVVFGY